MREKPDSGDGDVYAWKMIGKVLMDSANSFRRRQVGWIPLLAFGVAIALILWPYDRSGMFSVLAHVLVVSTTLIVWCPVFFVVARIQWTNHRHDPDRSAVIAFISMCLHGALAVCALVPTLWFAMALIR